MLHEATEGNTNFFKKFSTTLCIITSFKTHLDGKLKWGFCKKTNLQKNLFDGDHFWDMKQQYQRN
jgi:hypothetical protein